MIFASIVYKSKRFAYRNYILPQDLIGFLPADKVDNAFEMLDVDGDGKVSLQDIRDAVLQLYKVCAPAASDTALAASSVSLYTLLAYPS